MIVPLLLTLFFLIDITWVVYNQAMLQYAVTQGLRYGITSPTATGKGMFELIKSKVQEQAFNRCLGTDSNSPYWKSIVVSLYDNSGNLLSDSTQNNPAAGSNGLGADGNPPLMEVSVTGYVMNAFIPAPTNSATRTFAAVVLSARSWDRMEAPPSTGAVGL